MWPDELAPKWEYSWDTLPAPFNKEVILEALTILLKKFGYKIFVISMKQISDTSNVSVSVKFPDYNNAQTKIDIPNHLFTSEHGELDSYDIECGANKATTFKNKVIIRVAYYIKAFYSQYNNPLGFGAQAHLASSTHTYTSRGHVSPGHVSSVNANGVYKTANGVYKTRKEAEEAEEVREAMTQLMKDLTDKTDYCDTGYYDYHSDIDDFEI